MFELDFRPNYELISIVRRFVSDFYERMLNDPDAVSRVALATHELLENAVKYSLDGATSLSITMEQEEERNLVRVRISNQAESKHIASIQALFDEMEKHEDPLEHYQLAMERTAKQREGSGLGLLRIRAEGEMKMTHSLDGNIVCIVAETFVGRSS